MDNAGQRAGYLDLDQRAPVVMVRRLHGRIDDPFEREFYVVRRHVAEAVGPLDPGLKSKGNRGRAELFDLLRRIQFPLP